MQMLHPSQIKKVVIYGLFLTLNFATFHLVAQTQFDVRLSEARESEDGEICYEVSLASASQESWGLANQNYRLYYDSELLEFKKGISLLGDEFNDFTLVQMKEEVDASSIDGCLHYAKYLGFLNYSIDLLRATSTMEVPAKGQWLPTTQLCFYSKMLEEESTLPTLTWAREKVTGNYATSFVEVSEWVSPGKNTSAEGNQFLDIGDPCEKVEEARREETSNAIIGQIQESLYDIRLLEGKITESQACYEVALRSSMDRSWHLAGQNYRLYYDANQLTFASGESLLGEGYQAFNLVQNITATDASEANGCLHFASNMGFLNYSIDQLNTSESGATLPAGEGWLPTTQLCFTKNTTDFFAPTLVWGREEVTGAYATSFVEITEWLEEDLVTKAQANNYTDINDPCESFTLPNEGIYVRARAFLQGAFDPEMDVMHDLLRGKKLIPTIEPYSDMNFALERTMSRETIKEEVLDIAGEEAIVDWILLELRDKEDPTISVASRCAIINRTGLIRDVDGKSAVLFDVKPGAYYLVVRHRNHLGIMSEQPILFSDQVEDIIDFTLPSTKTFGENARVKVNGRMCLWGGNSDSDKYLIFSGAGIGSPDGDALFFDIVQDPTNTNFNFNHITRGYYTSDLNMDGEVRYQGINNDRDELIFFNVITHEKNINYYENFYIQEQLPDGDGIK